MLQHNRNASDTTRRLRNRVLYADRVIQQTTFDNGLKNYIILEGGNNKTAMTYNPHYYNAVAGELETTSAERAAYVASVPTLESVPDAPTNVIATPGDTSASIAFTIPTNDGGAPILSYTVESTPGSFTATGSASPIVISGLSNGTSYRFTVIATNRVGDSPPSIASSAVVPVGVPTAPTNLSSSSITDTSVVISFTAPTSNGGSAITNYKYSTDDGVSYTALSPVDTTSPITVIGLDPLTSYTIKIRAVNTAGDGLESSSISITTLSLIPNAPTLLYALADDSALWVYFNAGTDGGSILTNYQYSVNGGAYTDLSPADSVQPVRITGLTNGTSYTIALKAKNASGTSVASNTISGTPVAPSTASAVLFYDPSNSSSYSGTGTTITNIGSGGVVNGTFSGGVTYNSTVNSGVLDFTGANGTRITFPSYNFGNTISVCGWIYPRSKSDINGLLTNAGANVATNGFKFQWNSWLSQTRRISMQSGNGTSGGDNATPVNVITLNTWHHVAYVFDKTNRRILFFLNGEPANVETSITTVASINTSGTFSVGGYNDGFYTMNAQLGYVKAFTSLLDATQIRADYNNSRSRFA